MTLYAQRADGSLGGVIWSGAAIENFHHAEKWLTVETRPSGRRYPAQHPLVAQHQLSIERVWALPFAQLGGFVATEQTYVLAVVWLAPNTQQICARRRQAPGWVTRHWATLAALATALGVLRFGRVSEFIYYQF